MSLRPYVGACWAPGANGSNLVPGTALQIIGRDLAADAKAAGIRSGPVELWAKGDLKGFYAGDTSGLADDGWTKVAEL